MAEAFAETAMTGEGGSCLAHQNPSALPAESNFDRKLSVCLLKAMVRLQDPKQWFNRLILRYIPDVIFPKAPGRAPKKI
ncbi:hypothetical protein [Aurantiacibacter xanthus]|uniref:hypothetical protein n=1 Tax=Aurantiacibacter xanthus TaxID=1784712 RepID=UPI0011C23189|nr:hypothetical protein [Aurantiacibacter xanthus]